MVVLVVDDDLDDRELLVEAISALEQGINCIIAKDGKEALEYLNSAIILPDFIFLDMNMPKMDGKECLMSIRSKLVFDNIHVVMYSTTQSSTEIKAFKSMGAMFMQKPLAYRDLIQSLVKLFDSKSTDIPGLRKLDR